MSLDNFLVPITTSASLVFTALMAYVLLWQKVRQNTQTERALAKASVTTD